MNYMILFQLEISVNSLRNYEQIIFARFYNFLMFGHQFYLFYALSRLYSKMSIGEGAYP